MSMSDDDWNLQAKKFLFISLQRAIPCEVDGLRAESRDLPERDRERSRR